MLYHLLFAVCWLISLLPLRLLYVISDGFYYVVRYVVRYRLKVVRDNLRTAFPERSEKELRRIECDFYHFFCDLFVEIIKQCSMSEEEMSRRMQFTGLDVVQKAFDGGHQFFFLMLAHYGNWEWIASIQRWLPGVHCAQIYHKLYNAASNRFFLKLRGQYGGECVKMKDSARRLFDMKRGNDHVVMGFISDQQPKWNAIHHFTPFLNHDTAVFIGGEHLAKKLNAAVVYGHVTRPRRGYYVCDLRLISDHPKEAPDYDLTDAYMKLLEADIVETPHLWLWSHKRWSRTKEEWLRRQQPKTPQE